MKRFLVTMITTMLAAALLTMLSSGMSVGQNGYSLDTVSVSPGSACPGQSVTLSGDSAPDSTLIISMSNASGLHADLPGTNTDSAGLWNQSISIPWSATDASGLTVPLASGEWRIAVGVYTDSIAPTGIPPQFGQLTIPEGCPSSLPQTGNPSAIWLIAGAFALAGAVVVTHKGRSAAR